MYRTVKVGQTWKHWKGGLYKIISIGKFEPDPTRHIVTYEPMYETKDDEPWSRFLDVFLEPIHIMDNRKKMYRFELVEDI